jgi:hypothetical protein
VEGEAIYFVSVRMCLCDRITWHFLGSNLSCSACVIIITKLGLTGIPVLPHYNTVKSTAEIQYCTVLWRNRPMRGVITFRNFKEHNCATVAERYRILPPLPSFRVLLGYAVTSVSRHATIAAARHFCAVSANQQYMALSSARVRFQHL